MMELTDYCYERLLHLQNMLGNSFVTIILSCGLALIIFYRWNTKKKYNLPPGPFGLPILGYLPFLGSESYRTLHTLSQKYGSVFSLYLGRSYSVILGDYEAVKEAFNKSTTTDRPEKLFGLIPDGVGFSSVNGEEWVEQRRYSVKAMRQLGMGRSTWEKLVEDEVEDFVKIVSKYDGRPAYIYRVLSASVSNNISSLVLGKRHPINDESIEFLNQSLDAASKSVLQVSVRNFFPWLDNILSALGIGIGAYKKELMEFNQFIRDQVESHKNRAEGTDAENYIDGYLKEIKNNGVNHLGNTFNYTNLYGNIQALFVGGSDTTRASIHWLLLIMAKDMAVQTKIHEEIDSVLGQEGKIQWADRASLPYTYAAIMEGQRWRTVAPLNTARVAMEDIQIQGYDVPKGTTIIANNWGLHHDTKYWEEPETFRPERFLSQDGKQINFKPESFVPFSYGKRNCPGETVAMMEILFYFVALMQKFTVTASDGEVPNLKGVLGLIYHTVPQRLCFIDRHLP